MTSPLARDIAEEWHSDHSDLTDELAALIDARLAPVLEAMERISGACPPDHGVITPAHQMAAEADEALALLRPAEAKR